MSRAFWEHSLIYRHESFRPLEALVFYDLFAPFDRLAGRGLRNAKPSGQFHRAESKFPNRKYRGKPFCRTTHR